MQVEESEPLPTMLTVTVDEAPHPACWTMLPDKPWDIATIVTAGEVPVPVYCRFNVICWAPMMLKPVMETSWIRLMARKPRHPYVPLLNHILGWFSRMNP